MDYVIENLRLVELVAIVNENKDYYDDFLSFLQNKGYVNIHAFVNESSDDKALGTIMAYLNRRSAIKLYDGILRPYTEGKGRWYFLAWILRDAPVQRLGPLVSHVQGASAVERRAGLLNEIRKFTCPLFPEEAQWEWPALSEIFISRLEGSRRALKGTLFEAIVRRVLRELFDKYDVELGVSDKELRLHEETYDVQVSGPSKSILIPVKTRETMGGGHALLFTRDIHKAISVAESNGFTCIPVVIAESWGGDLDALQCENFIYLKANPNQVKRIEPMLYREFEALIDVFRRIGR